MSLARAGAADFVVVRVSTPKQVASLRPNRSLKSRIVAVIPWSATGAFDSAAWSSAITAAQSDPATALGVAPAAASESALGGYLALIGGSGQLVPRAPKSADTTPPTAPSGLQLTGNTTTSLNIAWQAAQDDVGVVGYQVYSNGVLLSTTVGLAVTIPNLACGTTYTVGVAALDAAGNTSPRSTITASTLLSCPGGGGGGGGSSDVSPPSSPTGLRAAATTQTSASLSWSSSTDNVGVTGYGVFRNSATLGSTSSTSYIASGLTCGTTYTFAVDAYDAAGNHSPQSTVSITTSACSPTPDTQAPSAPVALTATAATQTSVSLSWGASTDNVGVAGYGVYQGSSTIGSTSATTYTVTGLSCGSSYSLGVDAYDAAGNRSGRTAVTGSTLACAPSGDTQPPSTPTGLAAIGSTQTSISVSWTASTDNVGVSGYGVYQGASSVGSTASTSYTAGGLTCGTTYTFSVDAFDAAGNRSPKATMTAATIACPDAQAPTVPTSFRSTGVTASSVSIAWNASTDNVGVAGYGVYQGVSSLGSTAATTFTVSGLTCGTSYTFSVDAFDAAGNRSAKANLTVSTSTCADTQAPSVPTSFRSTGATTTSVSLAWGASSDNVGVSGYGVYQGLAAAGSTVSTSYTLAGLVCGTSYSFSVDAFDAAANRSGKATVAASTSACADSQPPSTPTGLSSSSVTQISIALSWNASTDNVGVAGYGLYRNGGAVGTSASTTTTFSGLACGTAYTLGVDAYDAAGNRSAQSSVSVSTAACSSGGGGLFISPSGSDSAACSQAAPCRTFNHAYQVAQPGQVVNVGAGNYPGETIAYQSAKAAATQRVTFAPVSGASVSVTGQLGVQAQHLELDSMSINDIYAGNNSTVPVSQQAGDLVFKNLVLTGLIGRGVQGLLWTGGSVGGVTNAVSGDVQMSDCYQCSYVSQNITIDSVYFHDVVRDATGYSQGIHTECLHLWGGIAYVTVRNSRFYNCAIMDMFVENYATGSSGNVHDVTVENNFFDVPGSHGGQYSQTSGSLMFETQNRGNIANITARFNTLVGQLVFSENGGIFVGSTAIGNYGGDTACTGTQVSYRYNIWTGVTCGASDRKAALSVANQGTGDLHLVAGALAFNFVPTSVGCPATDIDGQARPMGSACDAGADEAG